MDVTPLIPADRQVIDSYGRESFRVSGVAHEGAILVFPDATEPWAARGTDDLTPESLEPVVAHGDVEILLVGCGRRMVPITGKVRARLRDAGIVIDAMDTVRRAALQRVAEPRAPRCRWRFLPAG